MTALRKHRHAPTPKPGGPLWLRIFVLALFIFCVNYTPIHLAIEAHFDDVPASGHGAPQAEPANTIQAEHDDADHHSPHFASDHLLRSAAPLPSQVVNFDLVTVETAVALLTVQLQTNLILTERQNPPGIPPPDPLQPRAPPLA